MLFPEKLDVDKKGRPSTAGSKIKVRLGQERRSWAWGGLGAVLYSLPSPGASTPLSGTLCVAGSSSISRGTGGLDQFP